MLLYYISTLSLVPYFTSRTFIPLFSTAALARLAPGWEWAAEAGGVPLLSQIPPWATSNPSLLILGALSVAEFLVAKNPELRALLTVTLIDAKIKAVGAFLLCFSMVEGDILELFHHIETVGFSTEFVGGQSFAYTWSFVIGGAVWFTSVLRAGVFTLLAELDEDDDLGLQGLLSWAEDTFSFVGVILAILMPVLALAVTGMTVLGLYVVRRYLEYMDEKQKVPCEGCGTAGYPCGLRCASCGQLRHEVRQVGWLGGIKQALAGDLEAHRLTLVARKRCPSCGDRYKERAVDQRCRSCGTEPFASAESLETYLGALRASLPRTLVILFVLGFIPVLGLIPGVLYYRVSLISSLRCYLPRSVGFLSRWAVRFINLFLLCLQPVPFFGAFTLPLMCLTNYVVYQSALERQGRQAFYGQLQAV